MQRRTFIQTALYTVAIGRLLGSCKPVKKIPGKILGASAKIGHLLRDGYKGEVRSVIQKKIVIIGGGVSGLSAARELTRNGISDFILLDLEEKAGGNAAYGVNNSSAYPLGAHYIPTPNNDLKEYLQFLQECNVIIGYDDQNLPQYNELYLCFDSQERLFINGRWQEGLIPHYGVPSTDIEQLNRFLRLMDNFRNQKGTDEKDAFAIPVCNSSKDEIFTALDEITMSEWMDKNGFNSEYLRWYVNYCCRDDFGTTYQKASAWAGIHYFAGRKGKGANAHHSDVITWPEGNGFLVNALKQKTGSNIQCDALAVKIKSLDEGLVVEYLDTKTNTLHRIEAEQCIVAVPQFVAARLLQDDKRKKLVHEKCKYVPWLVANLQLPSLYEGKGVELSWDNVIYNSNSLGYVDATHQLLQQNTLVKNLTYYLPLTNGDCSSARKDASNKTHAQWCELVLADLEKVHPGIRESVKEINIMLWGHAMMQPLPGIIHGNLLPQLAASINERIHFAHADIAGISIFEEAFYQGIAAARKIIQHSPISNT